MVHSGKPTGDNMTGLRVWERKSEKKVGLRANRSGRLKKLKNVDSVTSTVKKDKKEDIFIDNPVPLLI